MSSLCLHYVFIMSSLCLHYVFIMSSLCLHFQGSQPASSLFKTLALKKEKEIFSENLASPAELEDFTNKFKNYFHVLKPKYSCSSVTTHLCVLRILPNPFLCYWVVLLIFDEEYTEKCMNQLITQFTATPCYFHPRRWLYSSSVHPGHKRPWISWS